MSGARLGLGLALAVVAVALAASLTVSPSVVAGRSMEPALEPGDHLIVDRWSYRHRLPRPGEIVLVTRGSGDPLVKRVAGFRRTPAGVMVDLLGDNVAESTDSRQLGPFPVGDLRGRVVLRYWPPGRWGAVR